MRWLFADPANQEETSAVRAKLADIDHWWQAFQANQAKLENYLKRTTRFDFAAFMDEALLPVDARLMYEFGPALRQDGHRLVITPQSARFLRPMVRTLFERAPALAGWEFYAYRPADTAAAAMETVKSRSEIEIAAALVVASVAPGRKVGLTYHFPGQELDAEVASQLAFNATEALLGEQVLDTWIGDLDVSPTPPAEALPIAEAQIAVATLIRQLVDAIPREQTRDIESIGELLSLQLDPPAATDDYPDRMDVVSAAASDLDLLEATNGGQPFTSACHSKIGESFCYLKLDAAEQPESQRDSWLRQLAADLNAALLSPHVGSCFGTARGLRYAFIDLAVTDLKQTVAIARQVLAERRAPLRSWLQFHDDDLAAEWIGIYRETPAPPLRSDAD